MTMRVNSETPVCSAVVSVSFKANVNQLLATASHQPAGGKTVGRSPQLRTEGSGREGQIKAALCGRGFHSLRRRVFPGGGFKDRRVIWDVVVYKHDEGKKPRLLLEGLITPEQMQFKQSNKNVGFFLRGRGSTTEDLRSFTFQTPSISARDLMFSLPC